MGSKHSAKTKYFIIVLCLLVSAVVSATLISTAIAKYAQSEEGGEYPVVPGEYRFSCEYENGMEYIQMASVTSISFVVEDVSGAAPTVTAVKDGGGTAPVSVTSSGADKYTCTVDFTSLALADTRYTITVTSQTKYKENTISFEWVFVAPEDYTFYTVTKYDNRVEVDLYIGTYPADIAINYSTLSPDNLNGLMTSWTKSAAHSAAGTVIPASSLTANTHYNLVFFGDTAKYNVTEVGIKTAIPSPGGILLATPVTP